MAITSDLILYRYSPENMDEAILRKLFVGREKLLKSMVKEIENAARNKTPRFYLIVGPRGIGKSHFLVLLYHEIKSKLGSLLIPIKLREEEYSVYRASDLFLRILEEKKEDTKEILSLANEDEILHAAIEKLKIISKRDGKRYIIFIENLHELFKQLDLKELQKLRSIFQKYDFFSVVASAPMIFPGISDHDEPFYNFFETHHLNEFSLNEIEDLIQKIAKAENNKEFLDDFKKYEPKIHGMAHLTGGSPRLVILFYEMITRGELENIENAFFKIIDEHTPYYQEIFQLLTGQKRRIFDAVISSEAPTTPKQISKVTRLDLPTVTTQLRRLETDGYVISRPMGRYTKYEVRERLFRLWREMRQPLGRKRVSILLEFLQYWYTPEERRELFKSKFKLLETGEKTVIKELCYFAETLPAEFRAEALIKLTPKLLELGELEEAAYEIQKIKETTSKIKDKELETKIPLYEAIYEGRRLISEKKYEDALEALNKALELNPKQEYALSIKGYALGNLGRYDEALAALNAYLEIKPKDSFALLAKGAVLANLGKYDEALAVLNAALEIKPKDSFALSAKGAVLANLGKYDEALAVLNAVLEIKPKDSFALSVKGDMLANLGKYDDALATLNEVLNMNPKFEMALSRKGTVLYDLGRHEEALEVFNEVLKINPKNEFGLLMIGCSLENLGKNEEALVSFNKVLEINPKNEFALETKSAALLNLKRYGDALDTAKKIEDLAACEPIKVHTKLIMIKALLHLNRKKDAIEEIEKIKNNIYHRKDSTQDFIEICLDLALDEFTTENRGNGTKFMKMAYDAGSKLDKDKIVELIMDFLKGAAASGLQVIKMAIDETVKLQGDEYRELIRPINKAVEIVQTKDIQKYYDLQVEEREIVADIVKKITKSDELLPAEIKTKESRLIDYINTA